MTVRLRSEILILVADKDELKVIKKDIGKFLTVLCIVDVMGSIQSLYGVMNTSIFAEAYKIIPGWLPIYVLGGSLVNFGAIVGILMLKKWGVYLLFTQMGAGALVEYLILKPIEISLLAIFLGIALTALWFWALYRKWENFE